MGVGEEMATLTRYWPDLCPSIRRELGFDYTCPLPSILLKKKKKINQCSFWASQVLEVDTTTILVATVLYSTIHCILHLCLKAVKRI